ncbi:UNVERIFIED_CONTAM: Adenylate isopentenyltransferase 1, chloroplastic [Sesamum angustifolium]|uniref:Adenylate isopentenyltransferase 1, chloroplastic n=1 Tax=Sesamum angustifolium TaxID=2727405 RepID=A0AAW2RLP4_9LAMI
MRRLAILTKTITSLTKTPPPSSPLQISPTRWAHMSTPSVVRRHRKIVVIMGPTGCGKSKLSVDLASRFFPSSEIINSDKIQVYRGLDITTNKISLPERKNVRHHLLGDFGSSDSHPSSPPPTSALLLPPSFLRFFPAAGCPSLSAAQTPSSTHCWPRNSIQSWTCSASQTRGRFRLLQRAPLQLLFSLGGRLSTSVKPVLSQAS